MQKEIKAYCFSCRHRIVVQNPAIQKEDSVIYGKCPRCGKKVFKVLKNK